MTNYGIYHLTGDDGKQSIENGGLQKESENVYTLWCSGRTNMEGMLVELKFIKVLFSPPRGVDVLFIVLFIILYL